MPKNLILICNWKPIFMNAKCKIWFWNFFRFQNYGILILSSKCFLQQVMIYRKVQICKGKISFQVHSGWALTVYILQQKESFLLFSIYWIGKEKGHKTVGNFSQTSFRSGTRPLLSNNASPPSNIIHVVKGIRLRRVIKIYDNNKHTWICQPKMHYLEYLLNYFEHIFPILIIRSLNT